MTPFIAAALLITVLTLAFSLIVLFQSPNKRLKFNWFAFSTSIEIWCLGLIFAGYSQTSHAALMAWKLGYSLGVIWIAPLFYDFVSAFLNQPRTTLSNLNYAVMFCFVPLIWSDLFFAKIEFMFNEVWYIRAGTIYSVFCACWTSLIIFAHVRLYRSLKNLPAQKRRQVQYFFLATAFGFLCSIHTFLPKFGIQTYPWAIFGVPLFPIIMTYAILKYNLMEIRILIRRAALLIFIYICLLVLMLPIMGIIHSKIRTLSVAAGPYIWIEVVLGSVLLSAGPFLWAILIRHNDFFQEHAMAGITHELKSPLAAIEGALDLLAAELKSTRSSGNQSTYVQMIERNSLRLRRYIDDLLCVYKSENGSVKFHREEVDIRRLCENVFAEFSEEAKNKGIELKASLPSDSIMIIGDSAKLRQVISNLLSNAIKFTSHGSVDLNMTKTDERLIIKVVDSGSGILADELNFIFDRFFQGSSGHIAKGTGLGLSIAKAWVEAHGGKIWAESEGEGKGATVAFTLPCN
jgi:signal transduction histidine kinase